MSPKFLESMPKSLPSSTRPYLPYLPAVESGVVNLDNVTPAKLDEPLGVLLSRGKLPRQNDAGLIEFGPDIMACDHLVVIEYDGKTIKLGPSSKNDIEKQDGSINSEGVLTLTNNSGWLKIIGLAIDKVKNPWLAERLNVAPNIGRTAVAMLGLEAGDFEVTDIDAKTGIMTAKPRTPHY